MLLNKETKQNWNVLYEGGLKSSYNDVIGAVDFFDQ